MSPALYIIPLVLLLLVVWFIALYNRFIRVKQLVREAWSGIDVQLKRRHDLIPNLVEIVKGYVAHERGVFENVASLRTEGLHSQNAQERTGAENALTQSLKSLLAVVEAYPELKANAGFLNLQRNLVAIETDIQYARRYYNGAVREWNILVQAFPSNIVGGCIGAKTESYFEIELATQRDAPDVRFAQ